MSTKAAKGAQRKRTHKVSAGINKHRKNPLSEVDKVLMGKGIYRTLPVVGTRSPWRGVGDVLPHGPYNRAQVEENKKLYPHLFARGARR